MKEFQYNLFFYLGFIFFFSSSDVSAVGKHMAMQHRKELSRVAGYGEERLSSVLVTGTVVCDACLKGSNEYHTSYVAGAKVTAVCKSEGKRRKVNWARGTTDEFGDFILDLPSHLHGIPRLLEACILKVLRIPKNSLCRRRDYDNIKPKGIRLSSVGNSIRVYTAGVVRVEHQGSSSHSCLKRGDDGVESSTW